jgi:hypothetical protein
MSLVHERGERENLVLIHEHESKVGFKLILCVEYTHVRREEV